MTLDGYGVADVTPWETASGGKAVGCASVARCAVSMRFDGRPGAYDIAVQYFDENDGASRYRLLVAGREAGRWSADDRLPSKEPNGHTSTRHIVKDVRLAAGDDIRIEAVPDGDERAVIDYVELTGNGIGSPSPEDPPRDQ